MCGMAEVFEVDSTAVEKGTVKKIWSWQAKDHPELPAGYRKFFASTDDCKPIEGGKRVLISSSSGACALVERPSGRVVWYARVPAAHSIELLPNDRVIAAASTHRQGDRLMLFNLSTNDQPIWEDALPSAHGVVWDESRKRLWALGQTELRSYELKDWSSDKPSLALQASYALPEPGGHDLQAVPGTNDLVLSTGSRVHWFDRKKKTFRPHTELGNVGRVKCVSVHPTTGRTVFLHADGKNWWNHAFGLLSPTGKLELPGERLYKARWVLEND